MRAEPALRNAWERCGLRRDVAWRAYQLDSLESPDQNAFPLARGHVRFPVRVGKRVPWLGIHPLLDLACGWINALPRVQPRRPAASFRFSPDQV